MPHRAIKVASILVKQFAQYHSGWAMLLAICKHFSIRIDEHAFRQKSFDGMLWYDHRIEQWVILVNSQSHRYRSRFTIAHEIGHFILHRGLLEAFCCTPDTDTADPLEREANAFASELLMPFEKLLPYIIEYPIPNILAASRHLGVSQAAIKLRIEMWQRQKLLPPCPLWRLNPKCQADEFYVPFSRVERL